jgi:hypothetical protein
MSDHKIAKAIRAIFLLPAFVAGMFGSCMSDPDHHPFAGSDLRAIVFGFSLGAMITVIVYAAVKASEA